MKGPRFTPIDAGGDGAVAAVERPPALVIEAALSDSIGDLVDSLVQVERMIAGLTAMRAEIVDAARRASGVAQLAAGERSRAYELAFRSLRAELACALRISERSAEGILMTSEDLVAGMPLALAALKRGDIGYRHVQILVEHARHFDGDAAAREEFERRAVDWASSLNPPRFERKVRDLAERLQPQPLEERHRRAAANRNVEFEPARDGMAWLTGNVPAVEAVAISERLNEDARLAATRPGETRTLAQLRADIFCARLLDAPSFRSDAVAVPSTGEPVSGLGSRFDGVKARVFVSVPALTLLGLSEEPATLEGYGPIDPQTARELAAEAPSLTRILTHPESGATLSVGRDSYSVPPDLRRWLRVRDGSCRFVGCGRDPRACDADHTVDWNFAGQTQHDNLAFLCRGHHILKHSTRWRVTQARDGTLTWRSPLGRQYTTEPAARIGLPVTE
jgi:hypothetical protein